MESIAGDQGTRQRGEVVPVIPQLIIIVLQSVSIGVSVGQLAAATKEQLPLEQKAFRRSLFSMAVINTLLAFGGFWDCFYR